MTRAARFSSRLPPQTRWLLLLLVVGLIKAIFLIADPKPALFMGDSGTYLATSYANYIPTDRSFFYGLLLRYIGLRSHSLFAVVLFQTVLSTLSAWLVAVILVGYFRTSFRVASLCSLLCAVEPLQLISERYILAEAVSTFLFALLLLCAFRYLSNSNLVWLVAAQIIAVSLITIRISYLPIALLVSVVLPFLTPKSRQFFKSCRWSCLHRRNLRVLARQVIVPVVLSVLFSQGLLTWYKNFYGNLMTPPQPPAFLYAEGLFLASSFAPLIQSRDYPVADRRAAIFEHLTASTEDRHMREWHRWGGGGLCSLILKESDGDLFKANKLARKTALRAAKRNPGGVVWLASATFLDYFDVNQLNDATVNDEGKGQGISPGQVDVIRKKFRADFTQAFVDSLTKKWHRLCEPWYQLLVALPLVFLALTLASLRNSTPFHWLCTLCALTFLEGAVVTTVRPVPRFLTGMAWLSFVLLGTLVQRYWTARFPAQKQKGAAVQAAPSTMSST